MIHIKQSYEEYFKSYNRHPHDHDYDQHRHHHHPPSRDHPPPPPPPPPPREHPHDNDHHSNGVNDKTTLPSDWIYDHLEEYLSYTNHDGETVYEKS
ncbi:hypothetical protein MN116_006571 [Schistosoma mekongi]|uniref:Uncharacterized protein n=1 Tax=Schistosoma mekongi TaxID=38744 RepID=A0AAE1Z993_SCHME|nr:hypothetical protein MN116_006571 [Schistosoma mekongi]